MRPGSTLLGSKRTPAGSSIPLKRLPGTHHDTGVCRGQPGRTPALRGSREKVGGSQPPPKSGLLINQPQRFSVRGLGAATRLGGRKSKLLIFVTADRAVRARATREAATPGRGSGPAPAAGPPGTALLQQAPAPPSQSKSHGSPARGRAARACTARLRATREPRTRVGERGQLQASPAVIPRPQMRRDPRVRSGDSARGSPRLPASPSANFANFPRGPAGRSGRPRAPPRPPRTYRSGSPRRTCPPAPAAARAASPLGAGLRREAPRRRGNRARRRLRTAARGGARAPEPRD
ncbi:proline-rich protein 36-like [Phodopus roborovskii]|uniref:proline-rich protein 36-like n=1 Tax=Phodopus roborovskii TaxID=109678 RepID=UPI0021E3AA93|nr:proline-rich protein 36-like [Phodopus roborovskii]